MSFYHLAPPVPSVDFVAEAKAAEPEMIRIRRTLHQRPELSYHEEATARLISGKLTSMGINVARGVGGTGVVGLLVGGKRGGVVALRADMDALPIQELADFEFRSKVDGVMHACGHDTHVVPSCDVIIENSMSRCSGETRGGS